MRFIQAEGLDGGLRQIGQLALRQLRRPLGEIEAGGEVLAVAEDHAAAQLWIAVQLAVGLRQLMVGIEAESVAFGGAVEAHQQQVAAPFDGQGGIAHAGAHAGVLLSERVAATSAIGSLGFEA